MNFKLTISPIGLGLILFFITIWGGFYLQEIVPFWATIPLWISMVVLIIICLIMFSGEWSSRDRLEFDNRILERANRRLQASIEALEKKTKKKATKKCTKKGK